MAFVALMALRLVIGFHFFNEGTKKLDDKAWTAERFLSGAKGPLAPLFHQMVDDASGEQRLCMVKEKIEPISDSEEAIEVWKVDPQITFLIWQDFFDQAVGTYGFSDPDKIKKLQDERASLAEAIQTARKAKDKTVDTAALELQRAELEQEIISIRSQFPAAEAVLKEHKEALSDWLAAYETELVAHFNTRDRLDGFDRDGDNRNRVAIEVESLRDQVTTIGSDRTKLEYGWYAEVESIWDSYETKMNELALETQKENGVLALHRPFDQEQSKLKIINKVIPWFDTIVGALLILGLFTRFASLFAIIFLASVVLTQPPWVPGALDVSYQIVELFALVVIFATCAGRYGGLDFFFSPADKRTNLEETNS